MPKHNKNHKKNKHKNHPKNRHHNNCNNKQRKNKPKNNHHSKSKSNMKKTNTKKNNIDNHNRISQVIDLKIKQPSDNTIGEAIISSPISPIKLHCYDADVSDSDTTHHHHIHNPDHQPENVTVNVSTYKTPKMQILRSAKINHRNNSSSDSNNYNNTISPLSHPITCINNSISYLSPGFDSHNTPSLISQHQYQLSPLPTLHRASSEPIISSSHSHSHSPFTLTSTSPQSILKSESESDSYNNNNTHNVSFGEVQIHEFKLRAGSESDGVPEQGGYSLHLDDIEIQNSIINIDQYEQNRYQRWKKRAQYLHWNKKKLNAAMCNPEQYLFTAGRCDEFYSSLTVKEREKRLCIDKKYKRQHSQELNMERMRLDKLRSSRKKNNIFCNCKSLSAMSTNELKIIAKQYGIKVYENRKVKKGFLINQLKSKVLNYRDICCWNSMTCTCIIGGINCHSGTNEGNFQCGCVKFNKKCVNEYGRYVYKSPVYSKEVIKDWQEWYNVKGNGKENDDTPRVSFKL